MHASKAPRLRDKSLLVGHMQIAGSTFSTLPFSLLLLVHAVSFTFLARVLRVAILTALG